MCISILTVTQEIPAPFALFRNDIDFVGISRKWIKFPVANNSVSLSSTCKLSLLIHSYPKECLQKENSRFNNDDTDDSWYFFFRNSTLLLKLFQCISYRFIYEYVCRIRKKNPSVSYF